MKTLISFFSSNLSEIIAILWLLNIVFFIYAIFDTSKSGNNDLIIISLFWCMLNFMQQVYTSPATFQRSTRQLSLLILRPHLPDRLS